jgi:predicted dehydrogenase
VFIVTRHDTHADLAMRALEAGKHVFVEKPLALAMEDLDAVAEVLGRSRGTLTVGFNRRFAPLTREVQRELRSRAGPLAIVATINAGHVPAEHWTQDSETGGGRVVGEAVHWIDLARALAGSPIERVQVAAARDRGGRPRTDISHILLTFRDGSTAAIHYLASGAKSFPKERIDCFYDGRTLTIDNWRRLRRHGVNGPLFERNARIDKGQGAQMEAWARTLRSGGEPPIPIDELFEVSRCAIIAAGLAAEGGGEWRAGTDAPRG